MMSEVKRQEALDCLATAIRLVGDAGFVVALDNYGAEGNKCFGLVIVDAMLSDALGDGRVIIVDKASAPAQQPQPVIIGSLDLGVAPYGSD
jgi:hypothetical protein